MKKSTVLVIAPYYSPAIRAGGPVQSLLALVDWLGDEIDFRILALDHDLDSPEQFPGIPAGSWVSRGLAHVRFQNDSRFNVRQIRRDIKETGADVLYINCLFSPRFAVAPLLAARTMHRHRPRIILAPRGSLSSESLGLGRRKKRVFILAIKVLRLHRHVWWHASSEREQLDIENAFGDEMTIRVASNLKMPPTRVSKEITKTAGELRVVFVGRIARNKNLGFALDRLAAVDGRIDFTVVGPREDEVYYYECLEKIKALPSNINVRFVGVVDHETVATYIQENHLLFVPSFSENFGQAIAEALSLSRPVLISDQTPWVGLADLGVGDDISLVDESGFVDALQRYTNMGNDAFEELVGSISRGIENLMNQEVCKYASKTATLTP